MRTGMYVVVAVLLMFVSWHFGAVMENSKSQAENKVLRSQISALQTTNEDLAEKVRVEKDVDTKEIERFEMLVKLQLLAQDGFFRGNDDKSMRESALRALYLQQHLSSAFHKMNLFEQAIAWEKHMQMIDSALENVPDEKAMLLTKIYTDRSMTEDWPEMRNGKATRIRRQVNLEVKKLG